MIANRSASTFFIWLIIFIMGCTRSNKEDGLVAAARANDVNEVERLLNSGADINGVETKMLRQTALIACATLPDTNTFMFLLSKGANANAPANDGITPLMEVVTLGDNSIGRVSELIRLRANVNAQDANSNTVLMHAKAAGCEAVVQVLIKAGASK